MSMNGVVAAAEKAAMAAVEVRGRGEQRLIASVHRGESAAAEELVDRTYRRVYAALVRLTGGDEDLASDLTQETYRKAWKSFATFDGRAKASTWLYRIAYNTFLNHVRRPALAAALDDDGASVADDSPGPEEALRASDQFRCLRRAVLALPEDLRFAVTARYWAEAPVREIARSEGVTPVAIRKRLRRALRLLETALEEGAR